MKCIRSCTLCRNKNQKSELIRIVSIDNTPICDYNQNINSRGIYICKNKKCITNLVNACEKNKIKLKISCDMVKFKELLLKLDMEE